MKKEEVFPRTIARREGAELVAVGKTGPVFGAPDGDYLVKYKNTDTGEWAEMEPVRLMMFIKHDPDFWEFLEDIK